MTKSLIMCAVVVGIAGFATADFVIKPVSATADATNGTTASYLPGRTIDATGLTSGSAIETNDPIPTTWPGTNSKEQGYMWLKTGTSGWIEFDLGDMYAVSGMHVWNYNLYDFGVVYNRGAKDVTVQYKDAQGAWVDAQAFQFAKATSQIGYTGADYTLTQPVNAQHIRFSISTNWGGTGLGIQEVRFVGDVVPEPATMGLLSLGGLLGLVRRKR